jgi:hypothetical protein
MATEFCDNGKAYIMDFNKAILPRRSYCRNTNHAAFEINVFTEY